MAKIKLLDKNLINQIAAGEVIERPASVVKELVENSIDAGATRISVDISNETRDIRVADNGSGIAKDDLAVAFLNHATSKIVSQDDLWSIESLGFRGEALASIISIAKLTCTTKTKNDTNGHRATCENSEVDITEVGCDVGTIMEVKDLFFNTPARLKFLKNSKTEISYIQEIIQSLALSHPEITFSLSFDGNNILKTTGSKDLEVTISELYSTSVIKELRTIKNEDTKAELTISGVASTPVFTRSNKKAFYVFVNGRSVKCPVILKAIDNVYRNLIPKGKYPFIVLSLNLKPDTVDVNVHPTKREVRYKETNLIYNFVYFSIKNALEGFTPLENNESTQQFNYTQPVQSINNFKTNNNFTPQNNYSKSFDFKPSNYTSSPRHESNISSTQQYSSAQQYTQQKFDYPTFTQNTQQNTRPNIIGQFKNTYILIEHPDGLEIIDQHIAHERYLYETLKDNFKKNGTVASQMFFTSAEIPVSQADITKIEENSDILEKLGYKFEVNADKLLIKQLPTVVINNTAEDIISDLIECLNTNFENFEDEVLIMSSCKGAVKAGQKLNLWQMTDIIEKWQTTKHPQTCPHGRPISHFLPESEISKYFLRQMQN